MPEKDVNKTKEAFGIEGAPGVETKPEEIKKPSLENREAGVRAKEEELDRRIKEVQSLQDTIQKEWEEKTAELESLAELAETPETEEATEEEIEEEETGEEEIEEEKGKPKEEVSPIDERIAGEITEDLERDEAFREEMASRIEEIALRTELDRAKGLYPKMDEKEILLEIERDPSQNVLELAKSSQESRLAKEEEIRKEVEEKMGKEGEQAKTLPTEPAEPGVITPKEGKRDEWEEATEQAKRDLGV